MTSKNVSESAAVEPTEAVSAKAVDDQLINELVDRAHAEGLQLTGEGGLLQQLTKRLLESALEAEITDHLCYDKHDPAGKNGGNSRNGSRQCREILQYFNRDSARTTQVCALRRFRFLLRGETHVTTLSVLRYEEPVTWYRRRRWWVRCGSSGPHRTP